MERRLAAILAADVVGYSRLIREDEAGTLAALKAHREQLIEPKVAERKGRIEPCRDCRRLFCLSHATIASSLIWA